jgi:uncharacterized membrane protein
MSQFLLHDQENNTPNTQHDNSSTDIRLMRWFFLGLVALWILAAIIGSIIAFCLTGNPLCLSGFTALLPPAFLLRPIIKYLFPKDDREYEIEKIKANQKKSTKQSVKDDP